MPEIRLRYTEPLLREAVRGFLIRTARRRLGVGFLAAVVAAVACLVWLIARGDTGWSVGFLVAALAFFVLALTVTYVAHRRNTLGRFRAMRSPEAVLSLDEDRIGFASELGTSTMPWSAVTEIWRFPRFWLLLFSPSQFVTLPLDDLDEPAREFLTRKVEGPKG